MSTPRDDEVRAAVCASDHRDRRERRRFGQEDMVEGYKNLVGIQAELFSDHFERVDRGSVDIGLAGLAQTAVVHVDAMAFEQGLEARRPAIHLRRLHDFRHEEPRPRGRHHAFHRAAALDG